MRHRIFFYRQVRQDGGVRTAIQVDDATVFHRFVSGSAEFDPALLWYIDLRCEGKSLPDDAKGARRWLLENAALIKAGFARLAEKLDAGLDVDIYPLEWSDFPARPPGVRLKIVCSAVRRLTGLQLAQELRAIQQHWEEEIGSLPAVRGMSA